MWRVIRAFSVLPGRPVLWLVACGLLVGACRAQVPVAEVGASEPPAEQQPISRLPLKKNANYPLLKQRIIHGRATLAEVRQALTEQDAASLTNTVHALYSMRWHRGVFKLLYNMWMWRHQQDTYPELNWESIGKAPVRIALASTLNRIQIADTKIFQDYIRSFKHHEHEFIRAQVVVALGFNGDPADIAYLQSQVDADNHYVTQSAVTGLALMGGEQAREALIALWEKHQDNARGALILGLLRDAYSWQPPVE